MKKYMLIVIIIAVGLLFVPSIFQGSKETKLRKEIDRVGSVSGVAPTSVVCRNVELAPICYAEYQGLNIKTATQMLTRSGYIIVDQKYASAERVSATNESESTRVDTESSSTTTGVTLKFKDINVTL